MKGSLHRVGDACLEILSASLLGDTGDQSKGGVMKISMKTKHGSHHFYVAFNLHYGLRP